MSRAAGNIRSAAPHDIGGKEIAAILAVDHKEDTVSRAVAAARSAVGDRERVRHLELLEAEKEKEEHHELLAI